MSRKKSDKSQIFCRNQEKGPKVASWAVIGEAGKIVLKIWYWNFEFVSNFDTPVRSESNDFNF